MLLLMSVAAYLFVIHGLSLWLIGDYARWLGEEGLSRQGACLACLATALFLVSTSRLIIPDEGPGAQVMVFGGGVLAVIALLPFLVRHTEPPEEIVMEYA